MDNSSTNRIISWFSCGAASAVAASLAIQQYGQDRVTVVYCNTMANEHPDNYRFFDEIEKWLGVAIIVISSTKAKTIEQVFDMKSYMSGLKGAPCTVELKKVPRFDFQQVDDIHIFGYTSEEGKRIARFEMNNPELNLDWILHRNGYSKEICFGILKHAGIELPIMYKLGYKNNNCLGCVKASAPKYWNKIRKDFPHIFQQRAEQSRRIGCKLTRKKIRNKWEHIYLDELAIDSNENYKENLSCGPECEGIKT